MIVESSVLVMSLIMLFYLSHILTATLANFSDKLNVSRFMVGSIILAVGTSLPELVSGVTSSLIGVGQLSIGGVIGSNIANVGLALAIAAVITPIKNIYKRELRETIFVFIATIGFVIFTLNGVLSRIEGILLIFSYIAYQYIMKSGVIKKDIEIDLKQIEVDVLLIPISLAGVIICGYLVVTSSIAITERLGLSLTFFGLTILAVGTSLPEIATGIVSSINKQVKLITGTVVGSNIANMLLIAGIIALVNPVIFEMDAVFIFSLAFLVFITIILEYVALTETEITRNEGILLLLTYVIYLTAMSIISA